MSCLYDFLLIHYLLYNIKSMFSYKLRLFRNKYMSIFMKYHVAYVLFINYLLLVNCINCLLFSIITSNELLSRTFLYVYCYRDIGLIYLTN